MKKRFICVTVVIIILLLGKILLKDILIEGYENAVLKDSIAEADKVCFDAVIEEMDASALKVQICDREENGSSRFASVTISETTEITNSLGEELDIFNLSEGQKVRLCVANTVRQFVVTTDNDSDTVTVYPYCYSVEIY